MNQAATTIGLRERKKAQTREALRTHARRLFIEQGYETTTVAEIAAAAGVSEPTFFRYFSSKAEIALAHMGDRVHAAIDGVNDRPEEELPIEACRQSMTSEGGLALEPDGEALLDIELVIGSPELGLEVLRLIDQASARLAHDFERRLALPRGDVEARQTANAVMGSVMAVFRSWLANPEEVDTRALARQSFDRLERGFR